MIRGTRQKAPPQPENNAKQKFEKRSGDCLSITWRNRL